MLPDRYRDVLTLQKTKLNWSTSRLIAKTAEPPKKNRFLLGDYMSALEPLFIELPVLIFKLRANALCYVHFCQ